MSVVLRLKNYALDYKLFEDKEITAKFFDIQGLTRLKLSMFR